MSNIDIYVIAEGKTEKIFIRDILAHEFGAKGIALHAPRIGAARHKGGNVTFERMRRNIGSFFKQRSDTYVSTMVDFTRIDTSWPGYESVCQHLKDNPNLSASKKAEILEAETKKKIITWFPEYDVESRFVPYIEMHEFEALLFSDAEILAEKTGIDSKYIQEIVAEYPNPEEINGTPEKAPGRRLRSLNAGYRKVAMGKAVAETIGVQTIRAKCPHFNDWLVQLEELVKCK
ncbi:MAG: DUF4276 family protein [Gammaproteobacteria bacterium]|nr:DUF4276 family protein [Gammaproteobacteria bacterium]